MAMVLESPPSSSSISNYSNQSSSFSYDVFLSFLGEDTRKAFTDHLNSIIIIIIIILMYFKYSFKLSSLVCSMAMVLKSPSSSSSSSSEEEEEEEEEWASSSSSSSYSMSNYSHQYSSFSYDVFLSFRGEDTRKTFTDHLYTALKQHGIRTFRDDDAMDRGRLLKPELEKAIQQSQVSLIVFSKSYATSRWCLDEVLMIMEEYDKSSSTNKRREVVPVFYNIEPTDVRNQTGCFEEAFKGYDDEVTRETDAQKKKELSEKVKAWRSSLKKAGSLTGMVLGKDGYESEFITNIVNDIRKKVNYNALYIKGKLVGMKKDVAEIESWLQDPSSDSTILFIDGMGGIGKTTIAKFIFNMNCRKYDGCCFLENINETSNHSEGMLRLQRQLLSTTLKSGKDETIWNTSEGTIKVTNAICNKKVLIVLDDVATFQQLETLLGPQRFYLGSKVIITTRHTWLSTWSGFKVPPMVQTIRTLSGDNSVKLFRLNAFPQNQPIEPYYDQSELVSQAIHHCKGLPLALEVLGSNLRGKSNTQWKDAMSKLEKYPLGGIQKVLQLSYVSLEDQHDKNLFLHIACFFVGEDEDFIVKVLGACQLNPIIGIKNLTDRSLLYMKYDGKVGMHPLIREMGREVVRQESPKDPGKRSRLWDHEDCINVLGRNAGTEKIEGLMFDLQNMKEAKKMGNSRKHSFLASNFKIEALEKMKNLMLLQLNYVTFSGKLNKLLGKYKKFPRELRLLRLHGFPLKSIPVDIPLDQLVVLDMSYSKLKRVWDGYKGCQSLSCVDGPFKWRTIDKVERKIIQNLGLGSSNANGGSDYKPKVILEYGIFSACVTEEQIPSFPSCMYKERGPQLSFIVPSHHHQQHRIVSGFTLCLVLSLIPYNLSIDIYNKTKDLEWRYQTVEFDVDIRGKKGRWLSVWRCGNLLHAGDEIFVNVTEIKKREGNDEYGEFSEGSDEDDEFCEVRMKVEECCVNLIYDDDDDEDAEERKEGNDNVIIGEYDDDDDDDDEIMRWSDKVDTEDISDFVHPGMKYHFGHDNRRYYNEGETYSTKCIFNSVRIMMMKDLWRRKETEGNGLPTHVSHTMVPSLTAQI